MNADIKMISPRVLEPVAPLSIGLSEGRQQLVDIIRTVDRIVNNSQPNNVGRRVYRYVRTLEKNISALDPEIQDYVGMVAGNAKEIIERHMRPEGNKPQKSTGFVDKEKVAMSMLDVIHDIVDSVPDTEVVSPVEIAPIIPLEVILQNPRFRIAREESSPGVSVDIFYIKSESGKEYGFPMPSDENMIHKGGFPRTVLKILAGAPESTIEAELPPNDFDVIARGNTHDAHNKAVQLNIDPSGVEMVEDFDFPTLLGQRDIDLNMCFIGRQGLVYTPEAYTAAQTGHITVKSARRKLYGTEVMHYNGIQLVNQRGIIRLIKPVIEGKALSFSFTPLNEQLNWGIHWFGLARRWSNKKNFGELMDKLYCIGKKMGQVRDGENDIYDVLDRVHENRPNFNFDKNVVDVFRHAQWLSEKATDVIFFGKFSRRTVASRLQLERKTNDTTPYNVTLADYTPPAQEKLEEIRHEWDAFLERCKERNKAHELSLDELPLVA